MAAELVIAPEAERDLADAFAWYETRRVGLGEESLGCVDPCTEAIRHTPDMYVLVHASFRRGLARRFPHAVFYEHVEDVVTVYAVLHTSRDPDKWHQRLL